MQALLSWLPIIAMLVVFYLVLIIPERKRKKKYDEMLNGLKINDEIVTRGGIMGRLINIQDDYVIVESGPDKSRFKLTKQGISNVVVKTEENK